MAIDSIKAKVRTFLAEHIRDADSLPDDEDLFGSGLVNSLFAMQLVSFVESEFDLMVDGDDLVIDNFRSVEAISAMIARRTGAEPAAAD